MAAETGLNGHIALLLPDLRAGGAQRVLLLLARAFAARHLRVDLVLALADGELLDEIPTGVRFVPLVKRMPRLGRVALAIESLFGFVRYLREHQPDVVLSSITGTNLLAVWGHRMARVSSRLVLREAATLENLPHLLYQVAMRRSYHYADRIIALSDPMRMQLVTKLGLSSSKIVLIRNPVDAQRIASLSSKPLPEDFDANHPFFLAVGRLVPQKDYVTLIDAFNEVAKNLPVRLVVLGDGPERASLESYVQELSLGNRVEFRGFESNPYRWMNKATCLVLASRWEGYPNVVLEARSLGLPVVMTEYDSSAHLVGGTCAMYAPVRDPVALANCMIDVFSRTRAPFVEEDDLESIVEEYLQAMGLGKRRS